MNFKKISKREKILLLFIVFAAIIRLMPHPPNFVPITAMALFGGLNFQNIEGKNGKKLFEQVLATSKSWGTDRNMMYVVGATRSEQLSEIRKIIPNHFLLVPGVGAQGGNVQDVAKYGMNEDCGLLVNSSRGIIYKSSDIDFAEKARESAEKLQHQMDILLSEKGI